MWFKKKTKTEPAIWFPTKFWFHYFSLVEFYYLLVNKFKHGMSMTKGSDEFGRHTRRFFIPGIVELIVPYEYCGPHCGDWDELMEQLVCAFPGCSLMSMGGVMDGSPKYCIVHDKEFWQEQVDEYRAGNSSSD